MMDVRYCKHVCSVRARVGLEDGLLAGWPAARLLVCLLARLGWLVGCPLGWRVG